MVDIETPLNFEDIDDDTLDLGEEALPDPWADIARANAAQVQATQTTWDMTIRERAAQRAAEHGTKPEEEEGTILARYLQRMAAVVKQYTVIDAMHETHIGDLRDQLAGLRSALEAAEYARAQGPRIVGELNRRDAMAVAEYMATAPQFQDSKRKSWATPYATLKCKTETRAATFTKAEADEAESLLVDLYTGTDCVKETSKALWAEIKKRLIRTMEGAVVTPEKTVGERVTVCRDGSLLDIDTGETCAAIVVPPQAVQYKPGSSDEHYYAEVDGVRIDLSEGTIHDGRDTDCADAGAAGYGPGDPFGDDAE